MPRLVRITTVPLSLRVLLKGQMRFMKEQGFDVTMVSSEGPEVEPLVKHEGCPHVAIKLTRKISPFTDLVSLFRLVRLLRRIRPQIVHTHTPKAGLIGMWAAFLAGVPVRLHTIAGLPWVETSGAMRWLLKNVEKLTAWPARRIYPNSFVQRDFLIKEGIAQKKMKVLGSGSSNGIDCIHFSSNSAIRENAARLKEQDKVEEGAWIWIFVGRIVKDKGIGELLDSFAELRKTYRSDKLWMVGMEEPELDPLDERHRKLLHEHPGITCWGFQDDIRPYLDAADVLAFPSYREGFPNVPLQAGAMGCMLLLSDINGCNEIVDDGVNGILVKPKDTSGLTFAMMEARSNTERRIRFASAIIEKIRTQFDQKKLWILLLEEYRELLGEKGIKI